MYIISLYIIILQTQCYHIDIAKYNYLLFIRIITYTCKYVGVSACARARACVRVCICLYVYM